MIKKYNVSRPEKYQKDGQEKTFWNNVGKMTEFTKDDGSISRMLEIPAIGLKAQIFPVQEQTNLPRGSYSQTPKVAPKQVSAEVDTIEYPTEEINPSDIPF